MPEIENHYNELQLTLKEKTGQMRQLELFVRAYNDGAAFRYKLYRGAKVGNREIVKELTTFNIPGNPKAWVVEYKGYASSNEAEFFEHPLSYINDKTIAGMPFLMEYDRNCWVAITEAKIDNYAAFYIGTNGSSNQLTTKLVPVPGEPESGVKVRFDDEVYTPWRVLMIGDNPGTLIESEIIQNLNDPCAIKDPSWIKPGISAWDHWWSGEVKMEMPVIKQYIDLASEMGWPYMLVDWQWYGKFNTPEADITKWAPQINMPEIIEYAKSKNVKILVWIRSSHRRSGRALETSSIRRTGPRWLAFSELMRSTFFWSLAFLSSKSATSFSTASRRVTSCCARRFFSSCSLRREDSTHHWTPTTRSPRRSPPRIRNRFSRPAPPRAETPRFFLAGLASERRLILIMWPPPSLAELPHGEPDADRERRTVLRQPRGVDDTVVGCDGAEGVHDLDGEAELLLQHLVELRHPRAAAGQDDRVDLVRAGGGVEEIDRLLELPGHVLADAREDRLDALGGLAPDRLALLQRLGLLEVEGEGLLQGIRELVAAERDVAPEDRLAAREDVHVHHGGADVQQGHDAGRIEAIVDLVAVLQREDVDVDEAGSPSGLGHDVLVVVDLLLLRGDEEDAHRLPRSARVEDDVVEVDVVDVERDVLLRLPPYRLGELLFGHRRELDLLDDDRVARNGDGDVRVLDPGRREKAGDGLDDERGIHDRAIDDRLGREVLEPCLDELELSLFARLELDQLHGGRADVETDEVLGLAEQHGAVSLPLRSGTDATPWHELSKAFVPGMLRGSTETVKDSESPNEPLDRESAGRYKSQSRRRPGSPSRERGRMPPEIAFRNQREPPNAPDV